ncbi:MAG: hypothetical protein CMH55_09335 [Myxococcales bacterium]|nr:hypothetical protein [Myxococcales bacterium]
MPSNVKISFSDPKTGTQYELNARVLETVKNTDTQAEDRLSMNPQDGAVDLFVRAERGKYSAPTTQHLQIDRSQLSDEAARALQAAIETGDSRNVVVRSARGAEITLRSDVATERPGLFAGQAGGISVSDAGHFVADGVSGQGLEGRIAGLEAAAVQSGRLPEGIDLYTAAGVGLEGKKANLSSIQDTLHRVQTSEMAPNEKARVRSAAATNLAELMSGLGHDGDAGRLKAEAFRTYGDLVKNETVTGLKESMIFNGVRIQSRLDGPEAKVVDGWRQEIAPKAPPYEHFFKDGKDTVNISYAAGHGEGFYEGMTEYFKKKGFEVKEEGNFASPRVLTKALNGKTINVHLRHFREDSFKDINNPDYDMIVYGGHSNLGGNTRRSVENAPEATGEGKLIFLGLCSGKDNVDRVRKAFPDAQLVTTFNSSYFTKGAKDGTQFSDGEDARALNELINGVAAEADWQSISKDIKSKAVGWNHGKELGNYITPIDLRVSNRLRDSDADGVVDIQDKHFNLDVLPVKAQLNAEFEAKAPKDGTLNGDLPATAAFFANTVDLYNPTFRGFSHEGAVISDGYFKGGAEEPVVRFETKTVDGRKAYSMQVNDHYSHMGEEALRAVTMVEYNRHLANTEADYPIKDRKIAELTGLTAAAASLKYDHGRRDSSVWYGLVKHMGLPEGVHYTSMRTLIMKEKHDYTGSEKIARAYLEKLDPETQQALTDLYAAESP